MIEDATSGSGSQLIHSRYGDRLTTLDDDGRRLRRRTEKDKGGKTSK